MAKKLKLTPAEAAICDVLRANGLSLPESLGGNPTPAPEPEAKADED